MCHSIDFPKPPIVLLPGLNGDARVFGPQALAFPSMTVGRWLPPLKAEALDAYAARMARELDPGRPCVVGGVSFGGIVALEVARHLETRACVLIASSRDATGLPAAVRLLRPVAAAAPSAALRWAVRYGCRSVALVVPAFGRRVARLSPDELAFRQWAFRGLLTWRRPRQLAWPVFQIHGECDATFAARRTKADVVVRYAGHMLTLTHTDHVNEFLRDVLRRCVP